MGLLTSPTTREKLVSLVSKYGNVLCILCYVVGLGWFLALSYRPINAGTYFSENALLPGLVESHFSNDHGASDYYNDLKQHLRDAKTDANSEHDLKYRIPRDWLVTRFRDLGLDTYVQNYSFKYPVSILKDSAFSGQNVYAILRAPRAASTEAVIMSIPYRPPAAEKDEKTNSAIGLMLGLAKSFRRYTYWAKDIIFLVTEHESVGMQAWLDAYHNRPNEYIQAGELQGRGGSIQAAVNLEIAFDSISRFNLKLEGLNGQLPNLDLVNTAVKLCKREGITPTLHKRVDSNYHPQSYEHWQHSVKTMISMMWKQAQGSPSGNHGLFHKYRIESLTLHSVRLKNAKRSYGYLSMGKVVEGIFRSLNNLLERFHQSFFFYLLPSTDRYISIGLYMPPFGILAAPILIKAVALWINVKIENTSSNDSPQKEKGNPTASPDKAKSSKSDEKNESPGDIKSKKGDKKTEDDAAENEKEDPGSSPSHAGYLSVLPAAIMSSLFGLAFYHGPKFFIETSNPFRMTPGDGILWGAIAMQLTSMIFPRILKKKSTSKGSNSLGSNWQLQKCFALLMLGAVLGATSAMNISLAVFVAVVWVPVVTFVRPTTSGVLNWFQSLLLFVIAPINFTYFSLVSHELFTGASDSLSTAFYKGWEQTSEALLHAVVDSFMYGSWTFSLVALAFVPNWLVFWSLLWCNPE